VRRLARYVLQRSRLRRRRRRAQPSGPPKLVIFDFDGTIADTFDAGVRILNKLAGEFGFRPLQPKDLEKARDMRTHQLVRFLGVPARKMSRIARRGSEELHSCIHEIQPLRGMPEALRELRRLGYSLGIVTSNTELNVNIFLRNHGLEFFEFIRCSSKLLGKARMIRSVIRKQHVHAVDILFVGDETRDIEACQRVGIRIAAVTWGYNSRRSLVAMKPDFVFDDPQELVAFLARQFPPAQEMTATHTEVAASGTVQPKPTAATESAASSPTGLGPDSQNNHNSSSSLQLQGGDRAS
jgi:phosphoglycolate phosphatase